MPSREFFLNWLFYLLRKGSYWKFIGHQKPRQKGDYYGIMVYNMVL